MDKTCKLSTTLKFARCLTTASLCGVWMPEKSGSFLYWQPAPRWRLHRWLAKPDNPDMSQTKLPSLCHTNKYALWPMKEVEFHMCTNIPKSFQASICANCLNYVYNSEDHSLLDYTKTTDNNWQQLQQLFTWLNFV